MQAARLARSGELRIIFRHMLPSFLSHIIAAVTLAIPQMILAETSLSSLSLGLRPPTARNPTLCPDVLIDGGQGAHAGCHVSMDEEMDRGERLSWRKVLVPGAIMLAFWALGVVMWRTSGFVQPLLFFGYIGTAIGVGLGL